MSGLHPIDVFVVILYLVVVTFAGVWSGRFIKNIGDFFMPRRFGKALMITHAFGTGTASDQAVVVAAQTFSHGVSGIWWQWLWLPITPFYWLIAPIMRRLRAVTTADVYELRFDRSVAVLFAIVGIVGLSVKIGLMLEGASALIHSSSGGMINSNLAVIVVTAMFVTYGIAGGLSAAIITDFFQGLLTVVFSFLLLPFVLYDVGGLDGVRETIRDPQMLSLTVPGVIGPFFIVMFALQALIGIVAQPFIMGVCSAGRTEMDGRVGFMFGNIVKRICTIAWSLTGIAAVAWYIQNNVDTSQMDPDHVYGNIAREFFPSLGPGLLGLFVASLLAAVMNSCDSYMIASSGLFTKNIYRPLVPDKTEKHYVTVGRLASLLVVIGGIVFAYYVPNVKTALEIWFRVAPPLGIAFWLGLLWRRTTPLGAWAATIAGFGVWWLTTRIVFVAAISGTAFAERFNVIVQAAGKEPEISQPWSILMYTGAALLSGVVVSLVTPRVAAERLQRFYDLTRTPVQEGEVVTKPCTLPVGVTPPPRRMLLTAFGLEVPVPSLTSIVGFVVGCLAAALLVVGYMWLIVW
ncbi:MAG TPA: sodium:solute symporter family protein [Lacipirellulaceae bacterium]|nr:sodium:solute symporter family protein [Lacipirellulaceae bacterium]